MHWPEAMTISQSLMMTLFCLKHSLTTFQDLFNRLEMTGPLYLGVTMGMGRVKIDTNADLQATKNTNGTFAVIYNKSVFEDLSMKLENGRSI